MNLLLSYFGSEKEVLKSEGHTFLGTGYDDRGKEVYVFLKRNYDFPKETILEIKDCALYQFEGINYETPKNY